VLLIAIANVSNLALVRAAARGRELAVRIALGARRSRLARLLVAENLLLGVAGGIVGLVIAVLGLAALRAAGPELPRLEAARLDWRVAGFAVVASVVSGILVGLQPLLATRSASLAPSMQGGTARSGTTRGTRRYQAFLVAAEFGLALPLLVASVMLLQSLLRLQRVDPGFDARNLMIMRVSPPLARHANATEAEQYWLQVLDGLREVPGVAEAGVVSSAPPDTYGDVNNFDLVDHPVPPGTSQPVAPWSSVTPSAFATLGVRLVEGRLLEARDTIAAAPGLVVSRAWAGRYAPGGRALGVRLQGGGCSSCSPYTVVGVVSDV
jgi:putative ABC transport system permease protein